MKLSGYLMGLLVALFLGTAGTVIISQFMLYDEDYPLEGEGLAKYNNFNESFTNIAEFESGVNTIKSNVLNISESNPLSIIGGLYRAGINGVKVVFDSFGFISDMFNSAQTTFSIDSRLVAFGILAVTLVILVAILAAIFQTDV